MKHAVPWMSALVVAMLAFDPGLLPPPATDGRVIPVAAPAPPKSGGGRIGGPAKKDGAVTGTGRRTPGSRIGGK